MIVLAGSDTSADQVADTYRVLNAPYRIAQAGFYPWGSYRILGTLPRGFDDFHNFTLDVTEEPVRGHDVRFVGAVFTSSGPRTSTRYQMAAADLNTTALSFTTESVGDVRFHFAGRFVRSGSLARSPKGATVLEGVLTKCTGGSKTAESRVRFQFGVPKARYYVRRTS